MTDRRRRKTPIDWLRIILFVAVLLAVFAGTELIARRDAALSAATPVVTTEMVIPGDGKSQTLALPPVATAISGNRLPPVARSRSSR